MADERDTLDQEEAQAVEEEKPRPKTAKERREEEARRLAELEEERRLKKEEEKRQNELANRRKKRKLITPGVTLSICLIAAVTMFLNGFENERMLKYMLGILVCSIIIGSLIQFMFEYFAKQNDETVSDEGEVINKGSVTNDEVNG